ncbi:uncharacterized protein LOC133305965 isoform X2 [Gastrolobium bilobum]|uniref:uncharacterized protein LOC133305965 isoform X2 n=1 Tax=Gastrolobium bilobum TaxID=150636 RepID=UPI002AB095A0|nr:uncharacterized protein LOC133305965 isoform X2 [Gastrolobium bilobum]
MSDNSMGRVTITLGRSGQVVKRNISAADASVSTSLTSVGMKRSMRDRIGNNADSSLGHRNELRSNKRQRGDIRMPSGLGDRKIGKDDLRLKLMQKSASRRAESNGVKRCMDLREKLSKAKPPVTSVNPKQHMPEARQTRMSRQIPLARSSDNLVCMESIRCSSSPWTLDHNHIRQRSPDGFPSTSRGISPRRNGEDLQRRPLNRTYEGVRPVPYVTRDVLETTRPPSAAPSSLMARSRVSTLSPVTAKPVASHHGQIPPPRSAAQRASYVGDEQHSNQTVDGLLDGLGLKKYAVLFKAEEVDMTSLKQMRENDLKELGIPMGPRKKILLALLPRAKHQ